ncbi:MAG: HAMP domain-containing histidine kinase [Lachnospiraceae bacterium]|nr:HAMP domain-containing histidine kinase [Lachnospiraceae bacterium]
MVYIIAGILMLIVAALCIKIILIKRSIREIADGFAGKIETDTNTLIDVSTGDKDIVMLAEKLNHVLRELRKEHLQYHQGNAELKTAITNISHDLRTPLTAICGYLDMLDKTDDKEKQARYIEIMKERSGMMKQLTEELFKYSMIISDEEELTTETVYINQLLAECISGFYPALSEKGITPDISISDKRIERNVNKAALTRVFTNLLNNAVKYSDGDLKIILTDECEIVFSNHAKGLSAATVEQLFDRFYTVQTAYNSTGIGLSIVRALVERMHGSVSASYENECLSVRIVLPETCN